MNKVKIIDSPMGTGKTTAIINMINLTSNDQKIMFVTPFLAECDRIIRSCPSKKFEQPELSKKLNIKTKSFSLQMLLEQNKNITCTHALFTMMSDEIVELLKGKNYILILDEVLNVIGQYREFSSKDIQVLNKNKFLTINEDYTIKWSNDPSKHLEQYKDIINMSKNNAAFFVNNAALIWLFPRMIFTSKLFDDIYVLTYMFNAQFQRYYFDMYDIPYQYYHIETELSTPKIVKTIDKEYEKKWKSVIKNKITLDDANYLNISRIKSSINHRSFLSSTWYDKANTYDIKQLKNSVRNFMREEETQKRMYTTFKKSSEKIRDNRISKKSFVSINARATNEFSNKTSLAYMANRYIEPSISVFFAKRNISVDQDKFALSEMVQWVWRSAIRNNEDIRLFIPSYRMRILFEKWLNNEPIEFTHEDVENFNNV